MQKQNKDIPVLGVIAPAAEAAAAVSQNGKIALMATEATVRSGEYVRLLKKLRPDAEIVALGCPKLVPLIESGHISAGDELINEALDEYLRTFNEVGVDTVILGCTHYPLIAPLVQAKMGEGVTLIDSGGVSAGALVKRLEESDALTDSQNAGKAVFCCSAKKEDFARVAEIFLGRDISESLSQVDLS